MFSRLPMSDSTSSTSSADDLLKEFLQLLQNSLSSSTSYSATGTGDSSSSLSALLIDYKS